LSWDSAQYCSGTPEAHNWPCLRIFPPPETDGFFFYLGEGNSCLRAVGATLCFFPTLLFVSGTTPFQKGEELGFILFSPFLLSGLVEGDPPPAFLPLLGRSRGVFPPFFGAPSAAPPPRSLPFQISFFSRDLPWRLSRFYPWDGSFSILDLVGLPEAPSSQRLIFRPSLPRSPPPHAVHNRKVFFVFFFFFFSQPCAIRPPIVLLPVPPWSKKRCHLIPLFRFFGLVRVVTSPFR